MQDSTRGKFKATKLGPETETEPRNDTSTSELLASPNRRTSEPRNQSRQRPRSKHLADPSPLHVHRGPVRLLIPLRGCGDPRHASSSDSVREPDATTVPKNAAMRYGSPC